MSYTPPHIKPSEVGSERARLNVRPGKKIPLAKLMAKKAEDKADHNVAGERKDVFALNARKWKH